MKTVAAINDICGFGKSSLVADISVLGAMGIQVCPLPTGIYTAQTVYPQHKNKSNTDMIDAFTENWAEMGASFDGIITGFLLDPVQARKVQQFVKPFHKSSTLLLVDPVMGDEGVTYANYSGELHEIIAQLAEEADILTPNLGELFLLAGETIERSELKCHQGCGGNCPKCVEEGSCPEYPKKKGPGPFKPTSDGTLDPSGFVYEGVQSNRLEGATATVFYKETVKDIYGDEVDRVTMWDAEHYGQVNPQLTNENGEYGWMVPTGLWQVKYEKQGYRTEYSEWLPVPPPQLDVNQAMMQLGEPQVAGVKATPRQVLVGFDKYMLGTSLTADGRVSISRSGEPVAGRLELVGAEGLTEQSMLAQKMRFVPATALPARQKLTLTVSGDVESYAGVAMGQPFTQDFDIEQVVEQLVADSALHVVYDQSATLVVQALPTEAAAGRKVTVKMLGDMVGSTPVDVLTLDAEGRAVLTVTGEAFGTTAVVLHMEDDPSVQTVVVVEVKDEAGFVCPIPVADYQPGQDYEAGTMIALSCSLPGATIYDTLDDSCPCDSPTRQRYTAPIALTDDMVIKAIATAPGYADSEVAELRYQLTAITSLTLPSRPAKGTYNMAGQKLKGGSPLGKGVYIVDGKKVVVK